MQAALINISVFQTEFVLQIGEAVCLMGTQFHQISLDVMRELKVAQESTYISRSSKGECYNIANHEGMASRFPFVRHSYLIDSKLELSAVLSRTLRKCLGSVGKSAVIHSLDGYSQSTCYVAGTLSGAGSGSSHGTSVISII